MAKHQPEDVRRRQILDAAKRCFIAKGLDATTMRDVAKEARLSLGGIYFHYASKADIFRAICNETYGTVLRKWEAEPEQRNSAEGVIMGLARINVEMIETDPDYFRLALVLNGAAVVDTELKAFHRERMLGVVKRCIVDKDIFASEFVIRAERASFRITEIPVEIIEKRPPTIQLTRRVPNVLKNIVRLVIAIRIRG